MDICKLIRSLNAFILNVYNSLIEEFIYVFATLSVISTTVTDQSDHTVTRFIAGDCSVQSPTSLRNHVGLGVRALYTLNGD
jgi:hypothetical protein